MSFREDAFAITAKGIIDNLEKNAEHADPTKTTPTDIKEEIKK